MVLWIMLVVLMQVDAVLGLFNLRHWMQMHGSQLIDNLIFRASHHFFRMLKYLSRSCLGNLCARWSFVKQQTTWLLWLLLLLLRLNFQTLLISVTLIKTHETTANNGRLDRLYHDLLIFLIFYCLFQFLHTDLWTLFLIIHCTVGAYVLSIDAQFLATISDWNLTRCGDCSSRHPAGSLRNIWNWWLPTRWL